MGSGVTVTAMNRSGWTPEQIEERRRLEEEGKVPPYDVDDVESLISDDYDPADEYWEEGPTFQRVMSGASAGEEPGDLEQTGLPAPKRSRSGDKERKKVVPRRPASSPNGTALKPNAKASADANA
eukprot:7321204-Alexandrium_andersonii.AAC.1